MEAKQFTEEKKERIVLVFDVGTQSTRALLINNRGCILAKSQKKHEPPYVSPDTDYAEQDAQFYYGKICEAALSLKEKEPALNDLAAQICEKQSLDEITYSDDNKYTSQVLLDAITNALSKAEKNPGSTKEKSTKSKTSLEPIEETTPAAPAESTPSAENTAETTPESNQENAAENTAENTPETSADTPAETAAAAE